MDTTRPSPPLRQRLIDRLGALLDSGIGLLEAAIDRVNDVDRIRAFEEALRSADRATAEFAAESAELDDELEREREAHAALRKHFNETACALGVEGEPDNHVPTVAWGKVGEILGLRDLIADLREELADACGSHRGD